MNYFVSFRTSISQLNCWNELNNTCYYNSIVGFSKNTTSLSKTLILRKCMGLKIVDSSVRFMNKKFISHLDLAKSLK